MINKPIHEEDITFINVYAPNIGAPRHIANINELKGRN